MGDKALGVIDIRPATGLFYDYDAKYAKGGSIHVLPAEIKPNITNAVQELALTAHQALGCRGVSRADLRYDDTPGGTGELLSARSQHATRHDRDQLGARDRGPCGLLCVSWVRWMQEMPHDR